jgi:hypothetical protein
MVNQRPQEYAYWGTHPLLDQSWDCIQDIMQSHGGVHILDEKLVAAKRRDLKVAVFIEMVMGEFAGEWLFLDIVHALVAVSDTKFIKLISKFGDKDFLISIHDAVDH